ncbi:MAG: Gfo/Idh/MocA family oxidoreductase [Cyclobacteriaceae bacterium]|nr:Gfo/Idh/MocA family oxidoreductase [Cyclobacteriaceae bacterium]
MEEEKKNPDEGRRSMLKGLIGVPLAAGALWGAYSESRKIKNEKKEILEALNINAEAPDNTADLSGDALRIGIIGFGGRGQHLIRVLGFATKSWLENMKDNVNAMKAHQEQEDLNVKVTAVCDVFDVNAEDAVSSFDGCKRYRHHEELINSGEVDAVIIATPDHWHAPISIKALEAGLHVYVEKPMTHNIKETYALRDAVLKTGKVLQVGHQHRQTQSFLTAQDIIKKKILGHISLVTTNTNRNSDTGAWQYKIHEKASPQTIDWDQFIGSAPKAPFNKEHFFRWRKWWAYGSGLSGDLMSHDYDRINCVLGMGMPKYVNASGGIYAHNDGREVPDVMQVAMEYPDFSVGSSREPGLEKGMTFVYSATLGNQYNRGTLLMGHDATMELGNTLTLHADSNSTRFKDMMKNGMIDPSIPIYSYNPQSDQVDGVTSATAKYFADKGLLWTFRDGKRVDSAHLHLKEWLNAIRNGTPVSCGIKEGFEEAMSSHMGGISWKAGRRMEWDPVKEEIIALPGEDLDAILLSTITGEYPVENVMDVM